MFGGCGREDAAERGLTDGFGIGLGVSPVNNWQLGQLAALT